MMQISWFLGSVRALCVAITTILCSVLLRFSLPSHGLFCFVLFCLFCFYFLFFCLFKLELNLSVVKLIVSNLGEMTAQGIILAISTEYFNISDSWMYMINRPCLLPSILHLSGPSSLVSKKQCRF